MCVDLFSTMLHGVMTFKPTIDSGDTGNYSDDYFPLGEEYDEELDPGWSSKVERIPASKSTQEGSSHSPRVDEDRNFVVPVMSLMSSEQELVFAGGWGEERPGVMEALLRKMSENEAHEKLQALQKKVEEFKRKVMSLKGENPKIKDADSSPTSQKPDKGGSHSNDTSEQQCVATIF